MGKAAARPEIFEFPGHGAKKIDPGHLKKPSLQSHPNTKGGTIPGGMHGTGGPSRKTLSLQELVELLDPAILGAFNATEKVGTLREAGLIRVLPIRKLQTSREQLTQHSQNRD